MSDVIADVILPKRHLLAESPVWDAANDRLIWVDIEAGEVLTGLLEDDAVTVTGSFKVDDFVGVAVPATDGTLTVAGHTALWRLWTEGGHYHPMAELLTPDRRWNDGAVDPDGRLCVGSLTLIGEPEQNILVRLEHDGSVTYLDEDLSLTNGMAWSPSGDAMYVADTARSIIWARDYDPTSGRSDHRSVAFTIDDGVPDGLATDTDGNLWVAVWGPGQVRCYTPTGRLLRTVHVPAPQTSSVAFVGPDLDRLLITTASTGLTGDELAAYPESGYLFTLADVGVRGVAHPPHAVA